MTSTSWSIASLVKGHERVALDADVLIYLLAGEEPRAARSAAIIDAAEQGTIQASMSSLAQAEVLVGPARAGDAAAFERTAAELRDASIDILSVTAAIAEDAAWLRGHGSMHLVDAIHLATARGSATVFITNDRRLRSIPGLEILRLDDMDLEQLPIR